jgi:hypothetical protein
MERFGLLGDFDAVEKAGCGAAQSEESGAPVFDNLLNAAVGVGLGVTIDDRCLKPFLIEPGRETGQSDGRHDVGHPGDIMNGGVGAVSQRVNQKNVCCHGIALFNVHL